jgi:GH15 family glucan-1,4-alpha-glucosidase
MESPIRTGPRRCRAGYAPIGDYALIGDGRTAALVARDGSIDWMCLPDMDSPSVFAAILDARRGGSFALSPVGSYEVERRYLPGTNVLETTFFTDEGSVRVTDALLIPDDVLCPFREVTRRVEGLSGRVTLRWTVTPRFGYGERTARLRRWGPAVVVSSGADAVAVRAWGGDTAAIDGEAVSGGINLREGERALLVLAAAHQEPLVLPSRDEVERRFDRTVAFWREWSAASRYRGPWRDAVLRSELALKLMVHAPTGAIVAAPTTSLPEAMGGERNWDYRYCWIRDSAFTVDALMQLGRLDEAHAFFWWFMHASRLTRPRLQVLYQLDGGSRAPERDLTFEGYCGSHPTRKGNGAVDQCQLDIYGDLFQAAWLYGCEGHEIDADTGRELARVADLVCGLWRQPDAGIWEVRSDPKHFTHSKVMCWVALDRAQRLAGAGILPAAHAPQWQREARAIRTFIETECWSDDLQSYARFAGSHDEVDASLLLMAVMSYHNEAEPRLRQTIDAVRRLLGHGPFVKRYQGEDGLRGQEGAFITCSFWLVEALARIGRHDEASALMDQLLARSNDVGLFAEEVDPSSGAFLGNFPQGLVHLALVGAAVAFAEDRRS